MFNKITLLLLLFCSMLTVYAQQNPRQLGSIYETNSAAELCRGSQFSTDMSVQFILDTMRNRLNIKVPIIAMECPSVDNCQAIFNHNRPYILFNPQFIDQMRGLQFTTANLSKINWSLVGILAHELGHITHFHQSRLDLDPNVTMKEMELEADSVSGAYSFQLGAGLEQAQSVMYSSKVSDAGSYTHPSRQQRLQAVKKGYEEAQKRFAVLKDTDGDGLADNIDRCPNEKGDIKNEGCPDHILLDSDGDGLSDKIDRCPYEKGPLKNEGCPEVLKPNAKSATNTFVATDETEEEDPEEVEPTPVKDKIVENYPKTQPNTQDNTQTTEKNTAATGTKTTTKPAPAENTANINKDLPNLPETVFIKGGTFSMGDMFDEGDSDEKPVHEVTLSDFYMGKYEVTNEQFLLFLESNIEQIAVNGSQFMLNGEEIFNSNCLLCGSFFTQIDYYKKSFKVLSGKEKHPVIFVTWYGAKAYCDWLSEISGQTYRLPTEAEWEYTAREKGRKVRFGNGKDILSPKQANFDGSSKMNNKDYSEYGEYFGKTMPVGSFSPNALGLYDMTGNVSEWCGDLYLSSFYKASPTENPVNYKGTTERVIRGGAFNNYPYYCRVTKRYQSCASNEGYNNGFRVATEK